jgi:hypothetical protein
METWHRLACPHCGEFNWIESDEKLEGVDVILCCGCEREFAANPFKPEKGQGKRSGLMELPAQDTCE